MSVGVVAQFIDDAPHPFGELRIDRGNTVNRSGNRGGGNFRPPGNLTYIHSLGSGGCYCATSYHDARKRKLENVFQAPTLESTLGQGPLHWHAELSPYAFRVITFRRVNTRDHFESCSRDLLQARALDYIQFDTNRVGGITQARKIAALAEAHGVPVIPHAGQMHNYHVVMASLNSPMAEYFALVDVEVGNELFWYLFAGEPTAKNGFVDLADDVPGLGLSINEGNLRDFEIVE